MSISPSKRLKQTYHRHHTLRFKPQDVPGGEPSLLEQDTLDKLLIESIKTICEEQAIKEDLDDPVIEAPALQSFRYAVEECMRPTSQIT